VAGTLEPALRTPSTSLRATTTPVAAMVTTSTASVTAMVLAALVEVRVEATIAVVASIVARRGKSFFISFSFVICFNPQALSLDALMQQLRPHHLSKLLCLHSLTFHIVTARRNAQNLPSLEPATTVARRVIRRLNALTLLSLGNSLETAVFATRSVIVLLSVHPLLQSCVTTARRKVLTSKSCQLRTMSLTN
jgi:hypothetical protein